MSALDILTKARELIADPARWTQGALARTTNRETVSPYDNSAICWCLVGACSRASATDEASDDFGPALAALEDACVAAGGGASIPSFNDQPGRTHAQVLAVLDAATESLKGPRP